jgi:hypothetical protein
VPTYEVTPSFWRDWENLSEQERAAFQTMRRQFVEDLKANRPMRAGLGMRRFRSMPGWYELRWSRDSRALFSFGPARRAGEPHIIWHRAGSHNIYSGNR